MGSELRKKKRKSPKGITGPKKGQLAYPLLGMLRDNRKKLTHEMRHALARLGNALAMDDGYESLRDMPIKRQWLSQRGVALHCYCLRQEMHWLTSERITVQEHERYIASVNALTRLLTALGIDRPSKVIDAEVIRKQLKEGGDDDELTAASADVVKAMGDGSPLQMEDADDLGDGDEKESEDTTTTNESLDSPEEDPSSDPQGLRGDGLSLGTRDSDG